MPGVYLLPPNRLVFSRQFFVAAVIAAMAILWLFRRRAFASATASFLILKVRDAFRKIGSQKTARDRELYFQTMAEAAPDIIWTAQPDGSDDYFNQKLFDYTGMTFEQLRGSGWTAIVHPDDVNECVTKWENARRTGTPYDVEYRLRRADGNYQWFICRGNPIRDSTGQIVKWFGTCTDIESQKHGQKILREEIIERTRQLADANLRLQEEQYFRKLADAVPEIIWTADPLGMVDYINRPVDHTGMTAEQVYGTGWGEAVHPDDLPQALEKWQAALHSQRSYDVEYRLRGKDGSYRWFLTRANPICDKAGETVKWIGTCTDIENQKHSQQVLEEQILERTMQLEEMNRRLQREMAEKELARKQFDNQNAIMMRDLEKRSERATMLAKMGELLQSCVNRDEVIKIALGFAPKIFPAARGFLALLNSQRSQVQVIGSWNQCRLSSNEFDTSACWGLRTAHPHLVVASDQTARCAHAAEVKVSYICVPILAQGEILGILHLQATMDGQMESADLSLKTTFAGQVGLSIANIRLREELRVQSVRDPLTGLYNRRHLEELLEREMRRAGRGSYPLGILMIDLDHFKTFNDTYGHDAGDAVLREAASLLVKCVRAEDFVFRFGGEEFVILLPTANQQASRKRAERLRMKMKELTVVHQGTSMGMLSISLGVATFPQDGATPKELMAAVDAALYEAKRAGRDQVVMASPKAIEGGLTEKQSSTEIGSEQYK